MTIPKFQQQDKLSKILNRSIYKGNKLALILKIYNNRFIRRKGIGRSKISPAVVIIKEMANHKFNLQSKSESEIAQDLQTIEEEGSLKLFNLNSFDILTALLLNLHEKEFRKNIELLLKSKHEFTNEETMQIERFFKSFTLFTTSPEIVTWIKTKKYKTLPPSKLIEIIDQKILESNIDFTDEIEKFEYVLKTMRDLVISELLTN